MKSIGEQLKEAREKNNISLSQTAQETKIGRKYLWALEEGAYETFPAEIYLVGFLRRYAEYLHLDSEPIVNQFKRQKEEAQKYIEEKSLREARENTKRIKKKYVYLLGGVSILILLFIGREWILSRKKAPTFSIQEDTIYSLPHPVHEINLEAKAKDRCWARVNIDGKESFEGLLYSGEKKSWKGKRIVTIRVGYVRGLELTCNNSPVDLVSDSKGDINELIFAIQKDGKVNISQKRPLKVLPKWEYLHEEHEINHSKRSISTENEFSQ